MNKLRYAFISLIVILSFACKRKYDGDYLAPEMKVASSNFAIVDSFKANYFNGIKRLKGGGSIDSISFERDSIGTAVGSTPGAKYVFPHSTYFIAKFNESVRWYIKIDQISQKQSRIRGATKTLSGVSDFLDSTNNLWNGNSDTESYFIAGDSVMATLSVLGSDVTQSKLLRIAYATAYDSTEAILLNDYEGGFSQIPYTDNSDPVPSALPDVSNKMKAPQGAFSFLLEGTDNNGDYFIGGVQQVLPNNIFAGKKASDIYFNLYIYGFGPDEKLTPNATKLNIGTSEDDNGNGSFEAKSEDTFEQQVNVDWVGWKLISVRYSNLKQSTSRDNGGSGNNIIEPLKAVSMNVNLIASPNGSKVGAALDYVIITYGKPYSK